MNNNWAWMVTYFMFQWFGSFLVLLIMTLYIRDLFKKL